MTATPKPPPPYAVSALRRADRHTAALDVVRRIAHDLGSPLNVVSGRTELISLDPTLSDETRAHLQVISSTVQRVAESLQGLVAANERALVASTLHIAPLVMDAAACVGIEEVTIEVDIDPELVAHLDVTTFAQVVTELLTNAQGATPDGGTVRVHAEREHLAKPPDAMAPPGMFLRVDVEDEGPGLSAEDLLAEIDPGRGEGPARLARGLALAARAAREHDGFLAVRKRGVVSCYLGELRPA